MYSVCAGEVSHEHGLGMTQSMELTSGHDGDRCKAVRDSRDGVETRHTDGGSGGGGGEVEEE